MWIPRRIETVLRRRIETRPVVVVTGARQTGKTSLVRRLFPGHGFVTLDYPAEADEAQREPESFLRRHPPPVIVDEVQYAPELIRFVKIAVDANRREAGQFVLTGSQPLRLLSSGLSALAGRASITELEPLSYAEARCVAPGLTPEAFLVRGGFPELHADPRLDARDFYGSYAATYLERDLRQFLRVSGLRDHARFLRAVALRTSQLLNRAELARDVGVSGSTAASWLSVLEATHQAVLLEPWFTNRTRSLVKSPKIFLRDSGLAAFLCGVHTVEDLHATPLAGPLWETLVCGELRRAQANERGSWDLAFYRDRSCEADFLVHRGGRFHLGDAKWSERPGSRAVRQLAKVARRLGEERVLSRTIFCRTPTSFPLAGGARAVSLRDLPDRREWN